MHLSRENFKIGRVMLGVALLIVTQNLLKPIECRLLESNRAAALNSEQLLASAGHGGALAMLGGMRSMVASAFWLRTNLAWERQDIAETTALINLTVAADERSLYFWLNGARILANDMPEWRMTGPVPRAYRAIVNEEQAQLALKFLEKGIRWRGPDPAFYVEMANIHLRRRGDAGTAAKYYKLAAEQPDAPYYAARIYGELLRELHRPTEALAWLKDLLEKLPENDPLAARDVVIDRIKSLEQQLMATKTPDF